MSKQEGDRWFRPSILTHHPDRAADMRAGGSHLNWVAPDSGDYHDLHAGIRPAFPHTITAAWLENALTAGVVPGREPWLEDDETAPLLRWRPRGLVESVKEVEARLMYDLITTGRRTCAMSYFEQIVNLVVGLDLHSTGHRWTEVVRDVDGTGVFRSFPSEVKRVILRALIDMKAPVPADTWRRLAHDPDCQLSAFVALAKIDRDDALDICVAMPDDAQAAEVVEHVCMFTWGGASPRFKHRISTVRFDCKPLIRAALGGSL